MKIQLLLIALLFFFGCRNVRKSASSTSQTFDSSTVRKSQIVDTKITDSATSKIESKIAVKTQEAGQKDRVKVEFGDTSGASKPVKIIQNKDGSVTVDPGGRRIKSISASTSSKKIDRDSSGNTNTQQNAIVKTDINQVTATDSGGLKKTETVANSSTSRSWPWWYSIVGAGAGILIILLIIAAFKYGKKIV